MEEKNNPDYGYRIGDRYVFRRKLGEGGNGSVFMAYDEKLCKCWAIKLCTGLSENELEALKRIDYYAFPRIVDALHQGGVDFLVMDLIEGETLTKYMKHHTLSERQILRFGRKIAEAINYLHNLSPALLYMDCKPENIMVTTSGDIRLIDLGSVYVCDDKVHNVISGTAFFAPGEVKKDGLHKTDKPDERSDIYSLGMTLYYLLTGSKTQYRDRRGNLVLRKRNKNISQMAERIVRKCTAVKMKDRYQNMKDVLEDLSSASSVGVISLTQRMKAMLRPFIFGTIDILCKCALALGVLFYAYLYSEGGEQKYIAVSMILGAAFLALSRKHFIYSWENKKDVFKGAGARILMTFLVTASAFLGVRTSASTLTENATHEGDKTITMDGDEEEQILNVIFYDELGRKMLIRPGAVWEVKEDISITIPIEEIPQTPCKMTIFYENSEEKKACTFFCKAENYNEK